MDKRTRITIETHRLLVVRRCGGSVQAWCPECGKQVQMVRPEEAAGVARVSLRTMNRWVEAALVHFAETTDGLLFICLNSLGSTPKELSKAVGNGVCDS